MATGEGEAQSRVVDPGPFLLAQVDFCAVTEQGRAAVRQDEPRQALLDAIQVRTELLLIQEVGLQQPDEGLRDGEVVTGRVLPMHTVGRELGVDESKGALTCLRGVRGRLGQGTHPASEDELSGGHVETVVGVRVEGSLLRQGLQVEFCAEQELGHVLVVDVGRPCGGVQEVTEAIGTHTDGHVVPGHSSMGVDHGVLLGPVEGHLQRPVEEVGITLSVVGGQHRREKVPGMQVEGPGSVQFR